MDFKICRLCLCSSEQFLNIFDSNESNTNIADILNKHFWFETLPTDQISTVICNKCWINVFDFHKFYVSVEEAQKLYEMKPAFKEELIQTTATWQENLLSTGLLKIDDTASIMNPLDEEALPHELLKTELELHSLNECCNIDDENIMKKASTKNQLNDDDRDIRDDVEDVDVEFIITTRRSKIKKASKVAISNKLRVAKEDQKKEPIHDVSTKKLAARISTENILKRQQWPPFCEKDEELIKKYITMACDLCLHVAENFDGMREHFKSTHKNAKPYVKCCGRKLGKRCLLVEHARIHENPEYIKCDECNKVFANSSVLRAHWLVHHVPEEQCEYKCDQCEKRFSRPNLLEHHKATHVPTEERKYVCKLCAKHNAFASEYHLQIHVSLQHRRATNVCDVCGKEIRDKAVFKKHVRLHFEDSGPRIKCPRPNCDRWLKDEDNLKQHLRRHNDEGKSFICNECGKNCKNRRALVSHGKYSHTNIVYTCDQCNKTFKKEISLKEHMAQHTGEPLYKCPFCPRTFNSNANMHSHKKKMHPIEWDNWRKTKTGSSQTILPSAQVSQALRGQVGTLLPNFKSF